MLLPTGMKKSTQNRDLMIKACLEEKRSEKISPSHDFNSL
jgi:hypothetical protein